MQAVHAHQHAKLSLRMQLPSCLHMTTRSSMPVTHADKVLPVRPHRAGQAAHSNASAAAPPHHVAWQPYHTRAEVQASLANGTATTCPFAPCPSVPASPPPPPYLAGCITYSKSLTVGKAGTELQHMAADLGYLSPVLCALNCPAGPGGIRVPHTPHTLYHDAHTRYW
jgi:hypothetical protein